MAFYEKVIKVKADVAALLTFLVLCGFRHISGENFALGSLRSDDWQLGRPTAPPLLSVFRVFSPPNASSLPCCSGVVSALSRACPLASTLRRTVSVTEHSGFASNQVLLETLADATPPLPCFYPHSEWAA